MAAIWLFLLKPNKCRHELMDPFEKVYIAHRGLFDKEADWPENSLAAFSRAVDAGYGIELDIQTTTDHKVVVFHDSNLKRMCGIDKLLCECSYEELQSYRLKNSPERIPLFSEVLSVIDGKVPLIVEVKGDGDWAETTRLLKDHMEGYPGIYCMESFVPDAVALYKELCPEIARGQLAANYFRDHAKIPLCKKFVETNLLMNWKTKPDFIAFKHQHANSLSYRICRTLFDVENVAWTIKNQHQLDQAKKIFQVLIFDSFIPK